MSFENLPTVCVARFSEFKNAPTSRHKRSRASRISDQPIIQKRDQVVTHTITIYLFEHVLSTHLCQLLLCHGRDVLLSGAPENVTSVKASVKVTGFAKRVQVAFCVWCELLINFHRLLATTYTGQRVTHGRKKQKSVIFFLHNCPIITPLNQFSLSTVLCNVHLSAFIATHIPSP